jgi:hypothetical protein
LGVSRNSGPIAQRRGPWKGDEIQFEPLAYTVAGVKMTEYFTAIFPSVGKMVWKATTETSEGEPRLELAGTRTNAKAH